MAIFYFLVFRTNARISCKGIKSRSCSNTLDTCGGSGVIDVAAVIPTGSRVKGLEEPRYSSHRRRALPHPGGPQRALSLFDGMLFLSKGR